MRVTGAPGRGYEINARCLGGDEGLRVRQGAEWSRSGWSVFRVLASSNDACDSARVAQESCGAQSMTALFDAGLCLLSLQTDSWPWLER